MRSSKLLVESREYTQIPYNLVVVYQKGGVFTEMVKELIPKYPELIELIGADINNDLAFTASSDNSPNIFLFFTDDCALDIVVHEVNHTVFSIFKRLGAHISDDSEEFFAYLSEFNFREVTKIIFETFKIKMRMVY